MLMKNDFFHHILKVPQKVCEFETIESINRKPTVLPHTKAHAPITKSKSAPAPNYHYMGACDYCECHSKSPFFGEAKFVPI